MTILDETVTTPEGGDIWADPPPAHQVLREWPHGGKGRAKAGVADGCYGGRGEVHKSCKCLTIGLYT